MKLVNDFTEYQILDLNNGKKLETWNGVILNRPDPQVIWKKEETSIWLKADAIYDRSNTGGGKWNIKKNIPSSWVINYHDLKFNLKLMGFKHTGLFPEQAYNWNLIREKIKTAKTRRVCQTSHFHAQHTLSYLPCQVEVKIIVGATKLFPFSTKKSVKMRNAHKTLPIFLSHLV